MACAALAVLLIVTVGVTLLNQPTIPNHTNSSISESGSKLLKCLRISLLRAPISPSPHSFAVHVLILFSFFFAEAISYGRTVARHITKDQGFLSYPSSAIVTIFSKQSYYDENGEEFWEAEVHVGRERVN